MKPKGKSNWSYKIQNNQTPVNTTLTIEVQTILHCVRKPSMQIILPQESPQSHCDERLSYRRKWWTAATEFSASYK